MVRFLLPVMSLILVSCISGEERLQNLFDDHWEYSLTDQPLFATNQGDHRFNDKLPETSIESMERRYEQAKEFLVRLDHIQRENLSEASKLNYDIFKIQLENEVRAYELNDHLLPLNGWWDYHASFADLAGRVPLNTVEDYNNYLSRLRAFRMYNEGYIERMRAGLVLGFVRPEEVFEDYMASIEALIPEVPEESRLYEPFESFPESFTEEERQRLSADAADVIGEVVNPEFERLLRFLEDEYIPGASESPGITEVPGGEEYYAWLVQMHTTMEITPVEVHRTGLDEVSRIRSEMMEIVRETGFGEDFEGFIEFLRTDPQFYAETPEELLQKTAMVLKTMDGKLPELFKTLPRLPYGIRPVPDYLAPRTATAYYSRGSADGTRAGYYAVNTYDLRSRPLYEVTALSLHEAVPGHHLQIALHQELEGLPKFRSVSGFTAYTEGWALYSERLGLDTGMYDDPYQNFGRLSYEMWRALRLVVDTGIHSMGWSREEAVQYMAENSALSLHNIRSEVNRYIFWPGQALAYKMGEIKIRELRENAERELGVDFDLREFHDVILLSGSVPLQVLDENVNDWIESVSVQ
ncbi:DUF885 domain-containing protein [Rhodohalobacter mucosus]|uniref:DUF885 domain-containing protein n=1 Tax=Rhodohalobacter mucosus TaxID=2079485 RepID=A0A316U3P8_9BACT|nr:DUF885 domain-containing protein [Rhodohalobacter mucosus]PWN08106.1 DUF885 domain-containing protein [Rhodohalobacter mucosus]